MKWERSADRDRPDARYGAALVAGALCGGLWALMVGIVLDAAGPGTFSIPLLAAVWAATGLAAAALLARPGSPRQRWGRAAIVLGFHGVALPVAAAISFVVAGAQWSPAAPGSPELGATVLGVRMAATALAIRAGVTGFVVGLLLLAVGDRALRGPRRPGLVGRGWR